MPPITVDEMMEAFDYACAIREEWRGASIEDMLRAFGLDPDTVREVLEDRWAKYEDLFDPARPELLFVQGWTEATMMMLMLDRGRQS